MQQDLFERSFRDAFDKYKRMNGLSDQAVDFAADNRPADLEDGEIVQSEPAASEARAAEHSSSFDHMYTRNELIDLGELSTAAASRDEIVASVMALNLWNSNQPAQPHHSTSQQHAAANGRTGSTANTKRPPANSSVAGTAAQAKSLAGSSQKQQPTPADQHTEQQHQGHIPQPEETQHSNQDASQQQQQYSQEDWNAYWQYYGYTALPPIPPLVPPQLCSSHITQLQQMMAQHTGAQPSAAVSQSEATVPAVSTRSALQIRANQIQDGDLTALLMSWFDAGYQTGKMEAQLSGKLT